MPTRIVQLLHQGSREQLKGIVRDEAKQPLPLAGYTLRMVIKAYASTPDDDPDALTLTTGEGIAHGEDPGSYTVTIPASDLATAGLRWYRVEAIPPGEDADPMPVVFGPMVVRDM